MANAISQSFYDWVQAMINNAGAAAGSMINASVARAELPTPRVIDATDLQPFIDAFNRADLGETYRQAINSPQAVQANSAMAAKAQSDILSQAQRDFILQYGTSRIQASANASARRKDLAVYGLTQSLWAPVQKLLELSPT